jgi:S-disulfanyl-L-cysteine oxidoreductase SoxD
MYKAISFVFIAALMAGEPQTADKKTVWDHIYAPAQAMRGKDNYEALCSSCHSEDLSGKSGPALKGDVFLDHWAGEQGLANLFKKVKTMPPGAREKPAEGVYLDTLAYLFEANGFPAGTDEMKPDILEKIRITAKDGSEEVPDFALVRVVGCLAQAPGNGWMLTNATLPVRTQKQEKPSADEIAASVNVPLGNQSYVLVYADTFSPGFQVNSHKGEKLEGRGFLIKNPNDQRLSVTWLEPIGSTCP